MSRRNVPTRKPAASTRRGVQPLSASASAKSITQARAQRDAKRGDAVTVDFVDETEMRSMKRLVVLCLPRQVQP